MQLYLIRHAQSQNNATMLADPTNRQEADPALTELGLKQAAAVGRFVGEALNVDRWVEQPPAVRKPVYGLGATRLYVSPMLRTLQTCQPIAAALDLQPEIWVDIHEHGGIFLHHEDERGIVGLPGLSRREINERFPNVILSPDVREDGWWNPAAGLESLEACQMRAIRVANALRMQSNSDQRLVLVTHGTFMDHLIKALLNLLPGNDLRFYHYNTAVTHIDFLNGLTILRYQNRFDHLPPELNS
jgi:2,3-bisphosphoglycerate-dependent phosphoglycerate mutase/probable phosphoglycerate mutase